MSNENTSTKVVVLLISNDRQWSETLQHAIRSHGVVTILDYKEGELKTIKRKLEEGQKYEIIIIDAGAAGEKSSPLIRQIQELRCDAKVVVASAAPTWRQAKEAFEMGAIDYFRKSLNEKELLSTFREISKKHTMWQPNDY